MQRYSERQTSAVRLPHRPCSYSRRPHICHSCPASSIIVLRGRVPREPTKTMASTNGARSIVPVMDRWTCTKARRSSNWEPSLRRTTKLAGAGMTTGSLFSAATLPDADATDRANSSVFFAIAEHDVSLPNNKRRLRIATECANSSQQRETANSMNRRRIEDG
jgi:hypothetical protein